MSLTFRQLGSSILKIDKYLFINSKDSISCFICLYINKKIKNYEYKY